MKKSIKDLGDIKGKRALVRVDVNVPLDENKNVTDDTRIQAILPTVNFLKDKGAKIILMAHLGRPKGEWNLEFSLEPVAKYLAKVLGEDVLFVKTKSKFIKFFSFPTVNNIVDFLKRIIKRKDVER